jgi:DNA replication protein DnaC
VLLASTLDGINPRAAAKPAGHLKQARKPYTQPALRILDELGSLPMDTAGADLLLHVLSRRYAQGAIILTANRALQEWPQRLHHDRPVTAAILDRRLPHAETGVIAGKSLRMRGQIEP